MLLAYTLLTGVMTWPLARNLTSAIPGDSFDGWQNYWNLWWMKTALVDELHSPLTTNLLYAPTGVSLYFHTLNPFNGLITLPVQLTGGLIVAYNAVVFMSWVLGGYGMFLLARWLLRETILPPGLPFKGEGTIPPPSLPLEGEGQIVRRRPTAPLPPQGRAGEGSWQAPPFSLVSFTPFRPFTWRTCWAICR
ncbi:MAG: hypothetical protein R2911_19550 [Caldilineaceae bacterium]